MSVDNVTYSQVAVLTGPLRQGFLTAALPAAAGWDSVDTLSVNLAESGGALAGTSQAAAQQGATLSLVDNEFLAYETATLVSGNAYNLTGLARGQGASSPTAHSSGAPFAAARRQWFAIGTCLSISRQISPARCCFSSFRVSIHLAADCRISRPASSTPMPPRRQRRRTRSSRNFKPASLSTSARSSMRPRWRMISGWPRLRQAASLDLGPIAVTVVHPSIAALLLTGNFCRSAV